MTLRISNIPELDSERDKKIQLLTIHASKGLEFDTLYFMGVDNESFLGTAKNVDKSEQEESRRLFYVGITRGKNKVVFTKPQQRMQFGETLSLTELSFINEIRERQIENGIPLVEEIEIAESVLKDKYRNNHYNYRGNYANSR